MPQHDSAFQAACSDARRLVEPYVRSGVAVDLDAICSAVGIDLVRDTPMLATGLLVSAPHGKWRVFVKQGIPRTRRSFTIAHEIGHLLLARVSGDCKGIYSRDGIRSVSYSQEERLADRLAAELLIPSGLLERHLLASERKKSSIWQQVHAMSSFFGVSVSAMVFRILECESLGAVLGRNLAQQGRFRVDCSRHVSMLFFDYPAKILEEASIAAQSKGAARISIEMAGSAVDLAVSTCSRNFAVGRSLAEQWTLGWTWLAKSCDRPLAYDLPLDTFEADADMRH